MTSGKTILLASAAAIGLLGATADAQSRDLFPFSGLYLSGGLGANILQDINVDPAGPPNPNSRNFDFDTGFVGAFAVGAMVGSHFRVEGELSYRTNDVGGATVENEGVAGTRSGSASALAFMLNGWVDLPGHGNFRPYAGGGAGFAKVSLEGHTANVPFYSEIFKFDNSETVFAFQLGAGVAMQMSAGVQVTLDYRYFHAGGFDGGYTGSYGGTASTSGYDSHSVMLGVRVPLGGVN
jgi:opacity protein-like surface antigen